MAASPPPGIAPLSGIQVPPGLGKNREGLHRIAPPPGISKTAHRIPPGLVAPPPGISKNNTKAKNSFPVSSAPPGLRLQRGDEKGGAVDCVPGNDDGASTFVHPSRQHLVSSSKSETKYAGMPPPSAPPVDTKVQIQQQQQQQQQQQRQQQQQPSSLAQGNSSPSTPLPATSSPYQPHLGPATSSPYQPHLGGVTGISMALRIDAADGQAYTEAQFIQYYGLEQGRKRYASAAAAAAVSAMPSLIPSSSSPSYASYHRPQQPVAAPPSGAAGSGSMYAGPQLPPGSMLQQRMTSINNKDEDVPEYIRKRQEANAFTQQVCSRCGKMGYGLKMNIMLAQAWRRAKFMLFSIQTLDPMDPSAYSSAPRGGWGVGLTEVSLSKAADTTAGRGLFEQRRLPSPGDVLRKRAEMQKKLQNKKKRR
eukprot:jgi/Bigna1/146951/aug1.125_g21659